MSFEELEARIERLEEVLAALSRGDFDDKVNITHLEDRFTNLEVGVNFLALDLRAAAEERRLQQERLEVQNKELESRLQTIEQQAEAIRTLSTPVMEIWDDILVLPVVGVVDTQRCMDIMNNLLGALVEQQARCVILDITGVEMVDTSTADHLLKVTRAAALVGARCVLTGISPAVAQTLVELSADVSELVTLRSLKDGLRDCLLFLHRGQAQVNSKKH